MSYGCLKVNCSVLYPQAGIQIFYLLNTNYAVKENNRQNLSLPMQMKVFNRIMLNSNSALKFNNPVTNYNYY